MINLLAMATTTTAAVEQGKKGREGREVDTGVITVTPTVGGTRVAAVFTNGGYKPQALNSNMSPLVVAPLCAPATITRALKTQPARHKHSHTHIINWRICNVAGVLYVSGDMLTWQSCQKIIIPASTPLFVLQLQLQRLRLRRRQRASICQRLKGQHISLPPLSPLPSHIFLSQFAAAQKNLKVAKKLANKLAANGFNK